MGLVRVALLCVSALYVAAQAQAEPVVLTEGTFDHQTSHGVWLVKFYAPWCGHCKKLAPTFDKVSTDPRLEGKDVHVAKVDCTTERSICERFSVNSYPTLKVVSNGKYYDYPGARDADPMVDFVLTGYKTKYAERVLSFEEFARQRDLVAAEQAENERKSAVVSITSATFEDLVKNGKEPWLIKFYAPWCGHCKRLAPTWHKLSRSLEESGSTTRVAKVDCTVHRRICSRFGVNGYPTLYYVNNDVVYKYQGGRTLPAFLDYVNGGWEKAESIGPIPDETFISSIVDSTVEWAGENTVMAILGGILAIAIFVAILVALLDYCLGADEASAYSNIPRVEQKQSKKDAKKAAAKDADKPKTE